MRHKQQRLLEQNIQHLENYIKEHKLKISPEEMILTITDADPDWQNFKNSKWLIKNLLNKSFLWEDIEAGKTSKAYDTLNRFLNIRKQWSDSAIKDINQYTGLSGIAEVIRPFEITKSMGELKREEKAKIYSETIVVYDKNDYLVVIPKTEEASCYWGRNTEWCTASTKSENYFEDYNKDAPLMICIAPDNKKYQFHVDSEPMDENDKPIKNITDPILVELALLNRKIKSIKDKDYTNPKHVSLILQRRGELIKFVSPEIDGYFEFCKLAVKQNGRALEYLSENDFNKEEYLEICKLTVKQHGLALKHISKEIEGYSEVCKLAVQQDGDALAYISPDTDGYFELCKLAVQQDGKIIHTLDLELCDKNIIRELYFLAVQQNGSSISSIPSEVEDYFELCKIAIQNDPWALQYIAPDDFSNSEEYFEICKIAVQNKGYVIDEVSYRVDKYFELCKMAVQQNGLSLINILSNHGYNGTSNIQEYFEICKVAVQQNGNSIKYIPPDMPNYLELCKLALEQNGGSIMDISSDLKEYMELCKLIIPTYGNAIKHISPEDEDYFNLCRLAVQNDGWSLEYIKYDNLSKEEYFEICKLAVQQNGNAIYYILSKDFNEKEDYWELCKLAVQQNGDAIQFVSKQIDNYLEICKLAIEQNKNAIQYISKEYHKYLKSEKDIIIPDWLTNKEYENIIDNFNQLGDELKTLTPKHSIEL